MNKVIMAYYTRFSFSIFLVFASSLVFAQSNNIDSLHTLLKTDTEDTTKISRYLKLCFEYRNSGEYDSALYYGNVALKLSKKRNYTKGIETSYHNIGMVYYYRGNYDLTLENYFAALKLKKESGDKIGTANLQNNIGIIFWTMGNFDKALENYYAALKIHEEAGNKTGMAASYGNIGNLYYNQGNFDKALENDFASLKIDLETGNQHGIAASYNNIGNIYFDKENYVLALENYFAALEIMDKSGDKQGIVASYGNIGYTYYKQGNYAKALEYNFTALKIIRESGDKLSMTSLYNNIAYVYFDQKNFREAKKMARSSLEIAQDVGAKDDIRIAFQTLSQCDSALSDWKGAYENQKLFKQYNDSIFNEESTAKTAEMSARYESEKKEARIQLMEKEKEKQAALSEAESRKQKIIIWSVASGLILVALVLIVVFRSLKITRNQKRIIEIQKDEVTKQREEIAHKNKDLTDSINYAKRIQSAILTSEQYLNDMFSPPTPQRGEQKRTGGLHCVEPPPPFGGIERGYFILYKPKDIVAGDFYWAHKTPDDMAIWVAADSTGHGVPGAFMSMIGNSLLNEIVVEKGIHEPDEILNRMRDGVIKSLGQGGGDRKKDGLPSEINMKDGMDAAICCWNKSTNMISFSGANNSLWIIRKKSPSHTLPKREGVLTLKPASADQVLAFNEDLGGVCEFTEILPDIQPVGQHLIMNPFTKKEFQLQPGDSLYTFTDGYCDQFGGPKGKKFKYKPFRELLISLQNKSMPEQREILDKTIEDWKGWMEQIDDICVFGVRVYEQT